MDIEVEKKEIDKQYQVLTMMEKKFYRNHKIMIALMAICGLAVLATVFMEIMMMCESAGISF